MADEQNLETIMGLIINGGNAKSSAMEAIQAAKKGDFDQVAAKLQESDGALSEAHNVQTGMLTKEASGDHIDVTLLTVHSQDHLMNAITFRDLAGEVVDVYRKMVGLPVETY
ncbi:PTS lactose/cellobiose transporter subunit IIA [Latilactobacillus sakei]